MAQDWHPLPSPTSPTDGSVSRINIKTPPVDIRSLITRRSPPSSPQLQAETKDAADEFAVSLPMPKIRPPPILTPDPTVPVSVGGPEPIHSRYFFDHPPPSSRKSAVATAINGSNGTTSHGNNGGNAYGAAAKRDRYARVSDGGPGFNALGSITTPTPTPDTAKSFDQQLDAATLQQQRAQHEANILQLVHEETDRETKEPSGAPLATLHAMPIRPVLNLTDLRAFLFNPLPPGLQVKAFIRRRKKILQNAIYEFYLEDSSTFLLCAQRRKSKTPNFLISMDRDELDKKSNNCIAKLTTNFSGTQCMLYDRGRDPEAVDGVGAEGAPLRRELAGILYNQSFQSAEPRVMTIALPRVTGTEAAVIRPTKLEPGLLPLYKAKATAQLLVIKNKVPKMNPVTKEYELNFYGRAQVPSVKNFILAPENDDTRCTLLFGKAKDKFNVNMEWPLSPLQAFGICLSVFDVKLGNAPPA